ncbi:MAG: hypothetical protein ACE5H8_05170 [Alphaproteobacteria bacterium]
MHRIVILAGVLLVAACANKIVSSSESSIAVETNEVSKDPKAIAAEHCAKYNRKAELVAVEPTSFLSQIYYYDCV